MKSLKNMHLSKSFRPLGFSENMYFNKSFRLLCGLKNMHSNKPLARPLCGLKDAFNKPFRVLCNSKNMHLSKSSRPLAFSIIELLLVLTVVSVFLGAVFIGYRTIHASTKEQEYAYKAKTFVLGLKDYYDVLGAYPQITCNDTVSWYSLNGAQGSCDWNLHPPSNPANCCALLHFIGPWATTWSYVSNGNSFTITTNQIPKSYIQAVSNAFNSLGLVCTTETNNSTTSKPYFYLSCTANNVPTTLTALNQ